MVLVVLFECMCALSKSTSLEKPKRGYGPLKSPFVIFLFLLLWRKKCPSFKVALAHLSLLPRRKAEHQVLPFTDGTNSDLWITRMHFWCHFFLWKPKVYASNLGATLMWAAALCSRTPRAAPVYDTEEALVFVCSLLNVRVPSNISGIDFLLPCPPHVCTLNCSVWAFRGLLLVTLYVARPIRQGIAGRHKNLVLI